MSNISEKLDENIERHLTAIAKLEVGSDEMDSAINQAVKLHKLRTDENKLELEQAVQNDKRELERGRLELEKTKVKAEIDGINARDTFNTLQQSCDEVARYEDLKERKKDRWFRVGVAAAEIILPLTLYGWLAYVGYAREFDGIVSSDTLKRVLNSIKQKR